MNQEGVELFLTIFSLDSSISRHVSTGFRHVLLWCQSIAIYYAVVCGLVWFGKGRCIILEACTVQLLLRTGSNKVQRMRSIIASSLFKCREQVMLGLFHPATPSFILRRFSYVFSYLFILSSWHAASWRGKVHDLQTSQMRPLLSPRLIAFLFDFRLFSEGTRNKEQGTRNDARL